MGLKLKWKSDVTFWQACSLNYKAYSEASRPGICPSNWAGIKRCILRQLSRLVKNKYGIKGCPLRYFSNSEKCWNQLGAGLVLICLQKKPPQLIVLAIKWYVLRQLSRLVKNKYRIKSCSSRYFSNSEKCWNQLGAGLVLISLQKRPTRLIVLAWLGLACPLFGRLLYYLIKLCFFVTAIAYWLVCSWSVWFPFQPKKCDFDERCYVTYPCPNSWIIWSVVDVSSVF